MWGKRRYGGQGAVRFAAASGRVTDREDVVYPLVQSPCANIVHSDWAGADEGHDGSYLMQQDGAVQALQPLLPQVLSYR